MSASTRVGPANVYVADNSPGEPVCVYGETTRKGEGLAVELYFSKKGRLKGVMVSDMDDPALSTHEVYGSVPKAALEEVGL